MCNLGLSTKYFYDSTYVYHFIHVLYMEQPMDHCLALGVEHFSCFSVGK